MTFKVCFMRRIGYICGLCVLLLYVPQAVHAQCLNIKNGQEFYDKCHNKENTPGVKNYVDSEGRCRQDVKSKEGSIVSFVWDEIDETKNWSIDATVGRVNEYCYGKLPFVGIVFGFKDVDNFSYFCVNGGEYVIKIMRGGLVVHEESKDYKLDETRKKFNARIKVFKQGNQVFFALNGNIVDAIGAYKLSGCNHGLLTSGKGKFAIEKFKIENDVDDIPIPTPNKKEGSVILQSSTAKSEGKQIVGSVTGFLIDKRGYLATNHHAVEDAGAIGVCLRVDGEWRTYDGVVIKDDPTNDLAIIKIEDPNFKEFTNLPYAFSFETEDIASEIFTLGYPQVQVMGSDVKYTTGVVNAITGIQGDPTHYQISAHIDHGNSGGPLFNEKGYIIGITDSGLNKAVYGDVNYAVKSTYLKVLADALPKKLEFAHDQSIALKKRTEQIKTLSQYVALILIAK